MQTHTYSRHLGFFEADPQHKHAAAWKARQNNINFRSGYSLREQVRIDRMLLALSDLFGSSNVKETFRKTMSTVTVFSNSRCKAPVNLRYLEEDWIQNGCEIITTETGNTVYRFRKEQE